MKFYLGTKNGYSFVRFHLGSGINGNDLSKRGTENTGEVRFHLGSGINGNIHGTFCFWTAEKYVRFHLGSGINGNS
ncbi:hypothetical protein CRD_00787 [Raphidiopsis brookii D9]|nr:hypothetical protein CRD_00787 [Raphidiopsis brookii D9]